MTLQTIIFKWVLWTLLFSLILGGVPWRFPGGGQYWIQNVFNLKLLEKAASEAAGQKSPEGLAELTRGAFLADNEAPGFFLKS